MVLGKHTGLPLRFPLETLHSKNEQTRMNVPLSSLGPACPPSEVRYVYFVLPALLRELNTIILVKLTLAVWRVLF